MNIFFLHPDASTCAQWHCDKHINKMITEGAQMVSTCLHEYDVEMDGLYQSSYEHHPMNHWLQESKGNLKLTLHLMEALYQEKVYRYGGSHKSYDTVIDPVSQIVDHIDMPDNGETEIHPSVPGVDTTGDPYFDYRRFYIKDKKGFAEYTKREMPRWLREEDATLVQGVNDDTNIHS